MANQTTLRAIEALSEEGVLGGEEKPDENDPSYLRWTVLQPEKLPSWLRSIYHMYAEIRWYWN